MQRLSVLVLVLLLTGCGNGVTSISDVAVGDCFNDIDGEVVVEVELIDCSEPHDNEVYAHLQIDEQFFPGDEVLTAFSYDACLAPFEEFVGQSYEESKLDYWFLTPTAESWRSGDRAITCVLYAADLSKLTGSAGRAD